MTGLFLAVFTILSVLCLVGAGTDRRHWRWLGVVVAVVGHANVMAWCALKPTQRWLFWGTIGARIATGVFVDLGSITRPWQEEMLGQLAGASAIIGGCGTLSLLVLARIKQRSVPVATTAADLREITLACPRCRTKQTIMIGLAKCKTCELIIEVQVRERQSE